jgi:hypothetical protein
MPYFPNLNGIVAGQLHIALICDAIFQLIFNLVNFVLESIASLSLSTVHHPPWQQPL